MANIDYSIKDVEKVVKLDGKVKNLEVSRLTAPGENFISLVLRVDFEVEKNNQTKIISTVAKRLPLNQKTDPKFNLHGHAMKNEIRWYTEIVPLLKKFAEEYELKLDFYPEYVGSRFSLDALVQEIDDDSVLILENLIPQGYQNDDRFIGFDFTTSKAILKRLAHFHAVPIAIKIKNPDLFQVLEDFLVKGNPNSPSNSDGSKKNPPQLPPGVQSPEDALLEKILDFPELASYVSKIITIKDKPKGFQLVHKLTKEPWNTTVHNDFWVNNVMVNHRDKEEEKEPLVKIVDFQGVSYGSFAKDLFFFLLTSVKNEVTKELMDDLLSFRSKKNLKMANIDYSIKDIEKIVKLDGQVKNVEVTRLTAPGENYLSLVLRVNLEVEKNNQTKIISTVAKRLPLNQKKDQEFNFNGHAMKNEINWYTEIVPLLKKFAEEYELGLDFYPEFFGSRLSLDASAHEADQDSVLLLENLIPQGYQNDDRYTGSDLITSKAILKKLALFHAFPIAIKIKNPELFKIIENFLAKCKPNLPTNPDGSKKNPFEPPPGLKSPEEALFEAIMNLPELDSYISHIKPLMDRPKGPQLFHKLTKEPWNTIVHNDFWVNNVMVNHRDKEEEREPLVKIVDFQMLSYGSFAKDLVFYLLSSVRNDVAKESMDELLRYYYEEFISILNKIDVNLELTYEEFLDEVQKSAAESEVAHALFFSTIIFGEKNSSFDPAVEEFKPFEHLHEMIKKMNQFQKDKTVLIVTESVKRNWL